MTEILSVVVLVLMYAVGLSVFVQKSTPRLIVATVFACGLLGHDWIFHRLSDDPYFYYLSAAACDLAIILIISRLNRPPRLANDVQLIAFISMVYNFIGWTLHMQGYSGVAYAMMYVFLYGWAVIVLLRRDPKNAGGTESAEATPWSYTFRINAHSGRLLNSSHQGEK